MCEKKLMGLMMALILSINILAQTNTVKPYMVEAEADSLLSSPTKTIYQFLTTSDFMDAAISSVGAFNSLVKKETYRTRITSLNNPTSSEMGFNLENEIQSALKPLLAKAKNTSPSKFSQVVSSLIQTPQKTAGNVNSGAKAVAIAPVNPLYSTLISLVGNLAVQEKKITREDLDSFILSTSKYFVQYEKLNNANLIFDQSLDRLDSRLKELQFDLKEYLLDVTTLVHKGVHRSSLNNVSSEELFLRYLDKQKLEVTLRSNDGEDFIYPSDGIKAAKEITSTLQKVFQEYQKIYEGNYREIRTILTEAKSLGKTINTRQVEASLRELEALYTESKASDVLSLRLNTLSERLKTLVVTEQKNKK